MANRQWLREYANGCAWGIYQVAFGTDLIGHKFYDVSACVFLKTGCTVTGPSPTSPGARLSCLCPIAAVCLGGARGWGMVEKEGRTGQMGKGGGRGDRGARVRAAFDR